MSATVSVGWAGSSVAITSEPETAPLNEGANARLRFVEAPAGTTTGSVGGEATLMPAPAGVSPEMVSGLPPVLDTVTVVEVLPPMGTAPKS